MLTKLRNRLKAQEGFTLIELLVVILIIGILAAIAIPSFLNQRGKGQDAAAKSSAREAATAMETYYTDNSTYNCTGATAVSPYAAGCDTALHQIENTLPSVVSTFTSGTTTPQLTVSGSGGTGSPDANGYRVTVVSVPNGRTFWVDKSGTGVTRGCAVNGASNAGGCVNGSW